MGKRKHKDKETDDELLRKLRRLERLIKRRNDVKESEDSEVDCERGDCESEEPIGSESELSAQSPPPQTTLTDPVNDNADAGTSSELPELPSTILALLGEPKSKEEIFGPKIREEISNRWGKIIMDGLNKDTKEKLIESIHIPENFKLLKSPKLNPEIAAVLTESTKNRDKRLERAQNQLGLGIAAITTLMTDLIDGDVPKEEIIKRLSEAGQVLLDLHSRDTVTRRQLITYSLDKKFFSLVREVKRDTFLFGENLGEKIKASKMAEKSGLEVKRKVDNQASTKRSTRPNTNTSSRQGNSGRGPSRPYSQRGRPGGPRAQASSHTNSHPPADRYSSKPNPKSSQKTV